MQIACDIALVGLETILTVQSQMQAGCGIRRSLRPSSYGGLKMARRFYHACLLPPHLLKRHHPKSCSHSGSASRRTRSRLCQAQQLRRSRNCQVVGQGTTESTVVRSSCRGTRCKRTNRRLPRSQALQASEPRKERLHVSSCASKQHVMMLLTTPSKNTTHRYTTLTR